MAQTTGAYSQACSAVEISTDGVTYTDISGSTQSVTGTEQSKMSGEAYTFSGKGPIVKGGKFEPVELAFAIVYTEVVGEAYETARAVFEQEGCEVEVWVRWIPSGGGVGTSQLTAYGPIVNFTYPAIDASSAAPVMGGFTVKAGEITTATIVS
jgi:hypothetical protein